MKRINITLLIFLLVAIMIAAKYFVLIIVSRPIYNLLIQNIVYLLCIIIFGQINNIVIVIVIIHTQSLHNLSLHCVMPVML